MTWLLVCVAGGVGAVLRHLVGRALAGSGRPGWVPTFAVNVVGSFLLGLFTGLAGTLGPDWLRILGTGLLGGFTTFSTASVDVVREVEGGRRATAAALAGGTLMVCVVAAAAGLTLGAWGSGATPIP